METVFISGSTHTTDPDSDYYRKELPETVKAEIDRRMNDGDKFVIGDTPGIDTQAQNYLNSKGYGNVEIYTSGNTVRFLVNPLRRVCHVPCFEYKPYSKEWYAQKRYCYVKYCRRRDSGTYRRRFCGHQE
jgi:hypothetical protein